MTDEEMLPNIITCKGCGFDGQSPLAGNYFAFEPWGFWGVMRILHCKRCGALNLTPQTSICPEQVLRTGDATHSHILKVRQAVLETAHLPTEAEHSFVEGPLPPAQTQEGATMHSVWRLATYKAAKARGLNKEQALVEVCRYWFQYLGSSLRQTVQQVPIKAAKTTPQGNDPAIVEAEALPETDPSFVKFCCTCGKHMRASIKYVGRTTRCSKCARVLLVPRRKP